MHLALDFEWRTSRPMQEIGYVRGEELNWMQSYIHAYLEKHGIANKRYLVFHQFKPSMLRTARRSPPSHLWSA